MPTVNEYEGRILALLLEKGPMSPAQLAAHCKKAYGWKASTIRSAQKSLLSQGLISQAEGILCAAITKEQLRESNWNQWIAGSFEWTVPTQAVAKKKPFYRNIWFWTTWAVAIVALALVLFLPSEKPEPIVYAFPEELAVCREALDKWQALDSYEIEATIYRYYSSKSVTQWSEKYWVAGKDWVYINYAANQLSFSSVPTFTAYMYRDGDVYGSFEADVPAWTTYSVDQTFTKLELWPMTFDWDAYELIYLGTTKSDYDSVVRFTVIDRSQEENSTVYEVQFQLMLSGKLNSIAVITNRAGNVIAKDVYKLTSSDADEIAQFIANQPLLPPIQDAVEHPE